MKTTTKNIVLHISQSLASKLGLSAKESLLIPHLQFISTNCPRFASEGCLWNWVSQDDVLNKFPQFGTKKSIQRTLASLVSKGVITRSLSKCRTKSLFMFTRKFYDALNPKVVRPEVAIGESVDKMSSESETRSLNKKNKQKNAIVDNSTFEEFTAAKKLTKRFSKVSHDRIYSISDWIIAIRKICKRNENASPEMILSAVDYALGNYFWKDKIFKPRKLVRHYATLRSQIASIELAAKKRSLQPTPVEPVQFEQTSWDKERDQRVQSGSKPRAENSRVAALMNRIGKMIGDKK